MRLKQLMSGSIGRKSKKNKKLSAEQQQQHQQQQELSAKLNNLRIAEELAVKTSPVRKRVCNVDNEDEHTYANIGSPVKTTIPDYSSVKPKHHYANSSGDQPYNDAYFIVNFSANEKTDARINGQGYRLLENKDFIPSTGSCEPSVDNRHNVNRMQNSLPRARTKIKTNPWLLSPATSPAQYQELNNRSFFVPIRTLQEQRKNRLSSSPKFTNIVDVSTVNDVLQTTELQTPSSRAGSVTDSAHYSDSSESRNLHDSSFDSFHDVSYSDGEHYSEIPATYSSSCRRRLKYPSPTMDAVELPRSYGVSDFQALDKSGCLEHMSTRQPIYKNVGDGFEFQYEHEFESRIEKHSDLRCSLDVEYLSDLDSDSMFSPPKSLHLRNLRKAYGDTNGNDSTATDDTICGEQRKSHKKHRYKTDSRNRRKPEHGKTKNIKSEEANDADAEDNRGDGLVEQSPSLADESFDSAIDSSMSTSDSPSMEIPHNSSMLRSVTPDVPGRQPEVAEHIRRAADVHRSESLQERVERLRHEKDIVDRKIREAREEERFRQLERARLQREGVLQRKALLLKTLQDLKSNLECQSQKLQTTYNTVLCMQKTISCQRRQNSGEHVATNCNIADIQF